MMLLKGLLTSIVHLRIFLIEQVASEKHLLQSFTAFLQFFCLCASYEGQVICCGSIVHVCSGSCPLELVYQVRAHLKCVLCIVDVVCMLEIVCQDLSTLTFVFFIASLNSSIRPSFRTEDEYWNLMESLQSESSCSIANDPCSEFTVDSKQWSSDVCFGSKPSLHNLTGLSSSIPSF